MSGLRTVGAALCVGAATVSGVLVGSAEPAAADLITRCVGQGGDVIVPGDLVVPAGKTCELTGTTVNGDVRIASGANLIATGTDFNGSVRIAGNGYLATHDASIAGSVVSQGGFGAFLVDTQVGGNATQHAGQLQEAIHFLYLRDSAAGGNLRADAGEVFVDSSRVGGSVSFASGRYIDIYDSVVSGSLSISGATYGTVVCDSEIYGSATVTGNSDVVQLGAHRPSGSCTSATYWGGSLQVSDNTAKVVVSNNIIRGNLTGSGNQPAPVGDNNRVRGNISGQFANLSAPGEQKKAMRAMVVPQQQKAPTVTELAKQRSQDALRAAEAVGKANL